MLKLDKMKNSPWITYFHIDLTQKIVTFEFEVNHEKVTVEKLEEYSKKVEIEISIDISFKLLL